MLAVLLIISIFFGAAAVGVVQTLDLPFWAALLAYPVGGSLGLVAAAAILSSESLRTFRRTRNETPAPVLAPTQQR